MKLQEQPGDRRLCARSGLSPAMFSVAKPVSVARLDLQVTLQGGALAQSIYLVAVPQTVSGS
jgi:hypothetical protein